ncbi:MAG: dihydrodipicolinate synthase family protein [Armatimonadota bacterium]
MENISIPAGVWSATPTPFTDDMEVDIDSVKRMIDHHLRLGVRGLFLAGTCGEGAWMTSRQRRVLTQTVAHHAEGRMTIAVQVTDNSAARILENSAAARDDGADMAIVAPPYFLMNATPENLLALYRQAIRESPLPIGIYDRGTMGAVVVPLEVLKAVYAEPNVVAIKDSSNDPAHREAALAARAMRPALRLFNGFEFDCVPYLQAGYDGLLLGGGIFNGYLAGQIIAAVTAGDLKLADKLQARMSRLMFAVYGGKKITCWLSGLKYLLTELGVFSTWRSYLRYPLTAPCKRAIQRVMERDGDVLVP